MKKHIIKLSIGIAALVVLSITACKKIENQYPSKVVDVTYPGIALKGDPYVSITVGTPYDDAGATLTDDITGAQSDITAVDADQVDVNTPGLYMVTYEASNANGFKTIKQRPVLVSNIDGSWDLSGTYVRAATGAEVNVSEVANGLYLLDNVGGVDPATSAPFVFEAFMGQLDDSTITVPGQYISDGTFLDALEETLTAQPGDTSFSYVVDNVSFGTATRVFVKQ